METPESMHAPDTAHPVLFIDVAPFNGGAQRSLMTLVEALNSSPWRPCVLSADTGKGGVVRQCRNLGLPVRPLRTAHWRRSMSGFARFLLDRLQAGKAIRRAIKDWRPAIVHANGIRAGLIVPRPVWTQLPVCVHDRDVRLPSGAVRLLARRACHIIAISHCVAEKWCALPCRGGLSVIFNGLDLEQLRADAQVPPAAIPPSPLVVQVADMVPWKRHLVFLDAMRLVLSRDVNATAVIVGRTRSRGDEIYLERVREHARRIGMSDALRLVTDAASAMPWLARAEVVVSTATDEPFGRTVVEALAVGRPVVAVRGGGPEEILAGCAAGILTADSAEAIADAVCAWLQRGRSTAVAAAAAERAGEFSVERMTSAVQKVYRSLIERN